MTDKKFNPQKLDKLNNPERLKEFPADFIIQQTSLNNPKVIMDIGAGTALFSKSFAQKYSDCSVYACDISDIMIDWMKENIVHQYQNIIPVKMDENKTPLEDGIADFLFMVNLHHELDSPEKMLNECYRLLKPEGKIAISDWRKEETGHGPSLDIRYEPSQIIDQLNNIGFQKIKIFKEFPNNFLVIAQKSK